MTPRRTRLWHVPHMARILWAEHPRAGHGARLGDLAALARLALGGKIMHVRGAGRRGRGLGGFLARDGARIHALYTHPAARRQGIASRLIAEAQTAAHRLELWTAQDNAAARALYAAHGFYPVALSNGQGNDEGRPDMRMIWQRSAP